jgi:tetratricopeptide (TPR) repeat protein
LELQIGKGSRSSNPRLFRVIQVQPRGPFSYYYRSVAYGAMGEVDKAIGDLAEAIRLDPQYAKAYNDRAWIYFEAGKLAQGLDDIQHGLELWPDNAASLDTRAHIYEALGRRQEAIADYKRVLALISEGHPQAQPTREALKRLGASVE